MRKVGLAACAAGFACLIGFAALPVQAQSLVLSSFFNAPINPAAPTVVEAEQLVFDAATNTITARGDVVLVVDGYILSGQSLVYNRTSRELAFRGAVRIVDPAGNVDNSDNLNVTGGMKQAFLDAITIDAYDGSRITADSMDYDSALLTVLDNAAYAPCGDCIDGSGNRVGWSMRASKIIYNAEDGSVQLENPSLALLGISVAWLPYLWLPDLGDSFLASMPRPSLDYGDQIGLKVEVSWKVYSSRYTDIILMPTLLSHQGFLMGAEWVQRFDSGSFRIKASGLYQMNPAAFTFPDAKRDWRGAIQSSGGFLPIENWKTGCSYTAFTDSAYLIDYRLSEANSAVNEVYVTNLDQATYFDARLQQYNLLNSTDIARAAEGIALPKLRFERIFRLDDGAGQINVESRMLGIYRELDAPTLINGVPYVYGFAGSRYHAQTQVSWQNQFITDFGVVATPFAGLRLDGATYNGASTLASAPPSQNLWAATPIAAMDVRYPMVASGLGAVHYVEPIAQLVYRGEQSSTPGITNEDSQSAVFDDTNLFSFNRFTGVDRQETGLRANVGLRYQVIFTR